MALEGVSRADAPFRITHPHAIHPERVKTGTKLFALFVLGGVFFFQVWFAERVLSALLPREGLEVWAIIKNQLAPGITSWSAGMAKSAERLWTNHQLLVAIEDQHLLCVLLLRRSREVEGAGHDCCAVD